MGMRLFMVFIFLFSIFLTWAGFVLLRGYLVTGWPEVFGMEVKLATVDSIEPCELKKTGRWAPVSYNSQTIHLKFADDPVTHRTFSSRCEIHKKGDQVTAILSGYDINGKKMWDLAGTKNTLDFVMGLGVFIIGIGGLITGGYRTFKGVSKK